MKIKILYEDPNILVVDKPSGIMVHGDGRSKPARAGGEKTIADWILGNYPKLKGVGEPMTFEGKVLDRPGIVHRLDADTSGVLLIAKNKKSFDFFKQKFMDREMKKTYHAIVAGSLREDRGVINKSIGRSPTDFRKYSASRGARGEPREAITRYKVLKRFSIGKNKYTYVEVYPKTGRTHQIRVHMKAIDHPIVCDPLYNTKGVCPKEISRMALHSKSIEFVDMKGKTIKVESKLPVEFENLLK